MKFYWSKKEIPYADMLEKAIPGLREEFLKVYGTQFYDYSKPFSTDYQVGKKWFAAGIKFTFHNIDLTDDPETKEKFPTAVKLTKELGDHCLLSNYSILDSFTSTERHSDKEFRSNTTVRIHIPIFIPEGDCFFELGGYEFDQSDIWAHDTQVFHTGINNTPYRRVVYLLVVTRESIGAEPGEPWSEEKELNTPEFQRGRFPKITWSNG